MIVKRTNLLVVALVFGLGTIYLAGCKKSQNKVIARADNVKIMQQDFEKELVGLPPTYQNYLATLEGKKQFLDILLREKILVSVAEKSGVAKKKEVLKSLQEYKERAKEQEQEFRKGLILREYLRELQDGELKVTEAELKLYYDQNKNDFQNPQKIAVSHILLPTKEAAETALQRLKKGEDFAKVAREISADPSAARGGMIGEVSRGDLAELPEFEAGLFNLKSGQISDVVKTKLGYHIIKKNGQIQLPSQSFEQGAPQIRRILEKKKFDQWMEKMKKEKKVWVDETLLASVSVPSVKNPETDSKAVR